MSAESTSNAVDVLGLSVRGASVVTAGAGGATILSILPIVVGSVASIVGIAVTIWLAWKKNKIYNLQLEELERHRGKDA